MKMLCALLFLQMFKTVQLEIVDSTLILRSTITLDCKYSGSETAVQIHWAKVNGSYEETICTIHRSYGKYISPTYMSRLAFVLENSSLDLSITLKETSKADLGIYVCYMALFPAGTMKKVTEVKAVDFSHIEPLSRLDLKEKSNITLNFLYTGLRDVNQVIVQKFTNGKMDLVMYCQRQTNGRKLLSYGFDFLTRSVGNCSALQNITLIIQHAAITDKGVYECQFQSHDMNQAVSVDVHIQTLGITSISTFALIIGSSLIVIVAIFTIAALCLVRTQKNKKVQEKQVNVGFHSPNPQLKIYAMEEEEHTYANFVPNMSFSRSWT
ncbi:hypothetical protein GDO81_011611 [Engystomops pustulosus]|uniref:Ig-like domain-containing protein n=1 Tax=Engystomops pustulosus TaxID=76066 RepID=A0AAV7BFI2_ENGPU|nr:hypothetical protein GDO81_011611 [Engystomops pustulosus]